MTETALPKKQTPPYSSQTRRIDPAWLFGVFQRRLTFATLMSLTMLAIIGVILILWASQVWGIGIRSDSVGYLRAADNLSAGVGLGRVTPFGEFKALVHFPPLYPTILSGIHTTVGDILTGARWLSAILFGFNILLASGLLFRYTRSFWLAISAGLILLVSPTMVEVHLWAMSEPLYLALTMAGLILLDVHLERDKRGWLVAASLAFAIAYLTRYIGLATIFAAVAAILLELRAPLKKRLSNITTLLAISLFPMVFWMTRNQLLAGTATNRVFNYHPISSDKLLDLKITVLRWGRPLLNIANLGGRKIGLTLFTLVGFILQIRYSSQLEKKTAQNVNRGIRILLLYFLAYSSFLIISLLFFDATIPLMERLLAPLYLSGLLIILLIFHKFWRAVRVQPIITGLLLTIFVLGISTFAQSFADVSTDKLIFSREQGKGYAYWRNQGTQTNQIVRDLPSDTLIYTDNLEKVYFFANRTAIRFPLSIDKVQQNENLSYQTELNDVAARIHQGNVAIIFYNRGEGVRDLLDELFPDLKYICGCDGGLIYFTENLLND